MTQRVYPDYWQEACSELAQRDPIIASLIQSYPDTILSSAMNPFLTLLRAIIGQQISVKAADAIYLRLEKLSEGNHSRPEYFLNLPTSASQEASLRDEQLREIGLSRQKIAYIKNIAEYFTRLSLGHKDFKNKSSKEIREELIKIKGVGEWTVEMFLIFYVLERDVFPVKDIGLVNTIKKLYGYTEMPQILSLKELWSPWSTVAVWYIWRSLDAEPVLY